MDKELTDLLRHMLASMMHMYGFCLHAAAVVPALGGAGLMLRRMEQEVAAAETLFAEMTAPKTEGLDVETLSDPPPAA